MDNHKIKISCIITTCDRPEFLKDALNSVMAQTLPPDEIIIVNNGKVFINQGDFSAAVKIYNIIPYAGVSQARNFGAALTRGDYLAFLDDDDLWSDCYLEKAEKELIKGEVCLVSRLDQLKDGQILSYKNPAEKLTVANLLTFNPGITGSNMIISRDLFFTVGGFDHGLPTAEDKSLMIEILIRKINIKILPENFAVIRMHSSPRLSDPEKISKGIYNFTNKYHNLMNRKQLLANWLKIYNYRRQTGKKIAGLQFVILYLLVKIVNRLT